MVFKVKEQREKIGMTQEQLAQKSGISRTTIVALEKAETNTSTTTETLMKIASALNCTVADIFCA